MVAAELRRTATMRSRAPERPGERASQKDPLAHILPILARHCQDRDPLPELPGFLVRKRLVSRHLQHPRGAPSRPTINRILSGLRGRCAAIHGASSRTSGETAG